MQLHLMKLAILPHSDAAKPGSYSMFCPIGQIGSVISHYSTQLIDNEMS